MNKIHFQHSNSKKEDEIVKKMAKSQNENAIDLFAVERRE